MKMPVEITKFSVEVGMILCQRSVTVMVVVYTKQSVQYRRKHISGILVASVANRRRLRYCRGAVCTNIDFIC